MMKKPTGILKQNNIKSKKRERMKSNQEPRSNDEEGVIKELDISSLSISEKIDYVIDKVGN